MTIVQLEYLLAVVNCGSFSAAAEQCFVTQPSLSMQIKNLEEELGVILLDRSRKPVVPTEAGLVVLKNAKEAIKSYNYIKESVNELRGEVAGVLRLGVIPTIAPYLLHRFLADFLKKYDKIDLQIREMTTSDIVDALSRDQIDVGLLAGGSYGDEIVEEDLFDDKFFAYVSPLNRLFERTSIRIEDIDPRELMLLSDGHCLRNQILELCQSRTRHYNTLFESGSLDTLMRVVDNSNAVTIIPQMAADFVPPSRKCQVKQLAKGATSRKITLAVRRTYVKQSLIVALKEAIMDVVHK